MCICPSPSLSLQQYSSYCSVRFCRHVATTVSPCPSYLSFLCGGLLNGLLVYIPILTVLIGHPRMVILSWYDCCFQFQRCLRSISTNVSVCLSVCGCLSVCVGVCVRACARASFSSFPLLYSCSGIALVGYSESSAKANNGDKGIAGDLGVLYSLLGSVL